MHCGIKTNEHLSAFCIDHNSEMQIGICIIDSEFQHSIAAKQTKLKVAANLFEHIFFLGY